MKTLSLDLVNYRVVPAPGVVPPQTRELWRSIMNYGEFDSMPVIHWACWPETRERWITEGMPTDADEHEYFKAVPACTFVGVSLDLYPPFDEEIWEETPEYCVFRGTDGVVQKQWKDRSSIPQYVDFTLKDARDWTEFRKRLQPHPGRIPGDLDDQVAEAENCGLAVAVACASLMGWIRNWMGVENMSYLMYDAPEVYADMVDTLAELTCWGIDQVLLRMKGKPDMGFSWEDICGKSGPLISPEVFRRCVAPGYTKIRNKLEEYDVRMLGIDSDGDIAVLVEPWLEAGVNVFFPIEIGTWNADPMKYRRLYGKEMRMIGGFNKLELEKGPAAIDAEIDRRIPLMRDGGFVVMPDHAITPGTSLQDYQYYLGRIRTLRF